MPNLNTMNTGKCLACGTKVEFTIEGTLESDKFKRIGKCPKCFLRVWAFVEMAEEKPMHEQSRGIFTCRVCGKSTFELGICGDTLACPTCRSKKANEGRFE